MLECIKRFPKGSKVKCAKTAKIHTIADSFVEPTQNDWFEGVYYYGYDYNSILAIENNAPRGFYLYYKGEFAEKVVDNNPLNLKVGKTYKLLYKHCKSDIVICKINRITQDGFPWSDNIKGIITDSYKLIKEVVVKDYDILSFKVYDMILIKDSRGIYIQKDSCYPCTCSKSYMLNNPKIYKIYSVKRLSDNKVFTIEDRITAFTTHLKNVQIIKNFSINEDGNLIVHTNWTNKNGLNLKKVEHWRKPLFTTEDGVDIFKGDSYCKVNNYSNYSMVRGFKAEGGHNNFKGLKFSTKEAAEKYIMFNKPLLSLRDICCYKEVKYELYSKLINLVKSRL